MILVTGATGLVGAHLCLALLEKREKVVALYRREKKRDALRQFFIVREKEMLFDEIIFRKADFVTYPNSQKHLKVLKKYIIVLLMFLWPIIKKTTSKK